MNKIITLKVINPLLAIAFLMTAGGGLVRFFAPDLIEYSLFRAVHPKFGVAMVALAVIHIVLNGKWIKSTYFKK